MSIEIEREKIATKILDEASRTILDNSRLDYNKTVEIIDKYAQKFLGYETSVPVIIVQNPVEAFVACCYIQAGYKINEIPNLVQNAFEKNGKIKDIPFAVNKHVMFNIGEFFHPFEKGHADGYSTTGFEYMMNIWNIQLPSDLAEMFEIRKQMMTLGMIYPMGDAIIVSEKPVQWKYDEEFRLHNDHGAAFTYAGYYPATQYSLHGVTVPDWLACTHSSEIPIERYNELTNADAKAEFIRKVGIERMLEMGTKIDSYTNYQNEWWTKSQYEIWDMICLFPNVDFAPHLKMANQTTGIWHVEALDPSCRTIPGAMKFRLEGDYEIVGIA
jgi:hypothetical protein